MKKFILFFFAMVLSTVTGFAKDIVFDVTVNPGEIYHNDQGSKAAGPQSITIDGVTIAESADSQWDQQYRIYKGHDLTVTSTVGAIEKIVFTCYSPNKAGENEAIGAAKYGPGCFTVTDGEYTYEEDGVHGTWVGNSETVVLTATTNQVRATQIVVTLAEPADPVVFTDVVDGGVYAIVNVQPLNPVKFYVLESVDGELTPVEADLKGSTKYAETAQYKAIELSDGRFAFQNVANGYYLAWRNHNGVGTNGNSGFCAEINDYCSWNMNDGTVFADYRTYWFYVNKRSETNGNSGTLLIGNNGAWNAWSNVECTGRTDFSNNFGFVACAGSVDFTKVNIAGVAEEASESIEAGKWYVVKQHRGGVSPIYDKGGNVWRASSDDVVAAGVDAADVLDYLVQFIPAGEEDVYNIQFANGRYFADGSEASNSTPVTTTEEEPGLFNVKYILDTPGHFGIYAYDMGAVIDNNGKGSSVVFWGNGEISDKVDGNNDFKIYEVEFAPKTTAAADLKELIKEVEAAYAANNENILGANLITETSQFSSPYTEPSEGDINALIDGNCATFWHSAWSQGDAEMHVHYLQVDLPEAVTGDLQVTLGRRANNGGFCANDNVVLLGVEASADGETFAEVGQIPMPLVSGEWYESGIVAVEGAKVFRFFNDESNGTNQRGYWHAGEFQLNLVTAYAPNTQNAEAAAAFAEALAAAKACGANATDADVAALQAAYETYVAALNDTPVEPEPTPVTFEFTDNEDGTITITPSDPEALYFFNIYSDAINTEYQQGTDAEAIAGDVAQNLTAPESEVHTGVSVVDPAQWLQYWFGGYVQYTAGDYRLGVVELAYDGTYSMAGEPVFHAFTKAAEVEPVDPVTGSIATITAVFPNGNKHVVYSNGEKLTAGVEAPEGAVVKFDVVSRTENTLVLKAGDQYIHWTSGDNNEKSADLDGLNEDFDEILNTLTLAPATLQGCSTSATWGKTEEDVQGLYRLQGMGTNGRLFDFTLREFDDAWIAGDPGNIFFDTNWDGNGCRTSFFEITFEEESTEETFPMEGVAYKFKNVDSQLYIKVVEDAEQCVTLGQTPDEMYFTAVEGGWTISNSKGYQLGSTAKGWNIGNTATPIVWTIEEVEGGYAFHNEKGYLGFDTAAAGQKAFRDKNYTTHHGIFNIWKYDEEEIIVVPDKTLEETWENIHTLLAEAEAIKELNEVTVTYDADGYFEDFTSPIVGKVGYKKHDDVWAVCDGADYVNSFVSYFETAAEADAYLADFGGLAALEEIITNVIDDYNAAEVVLPTPGKTYIIRNYPYTYTDEYSYAYYYNGEKLALAESANATTAEYMWTVSEPVKYSYFDADLNVIEETRYQFVNAADNTKFMSWRGNGTDNYAGVTTNAADANSKWYLTGKKVDGTGAHAYGTLALRTNADGNQYRTAVVDMRKSTDHLAKSNGDHFDATYSSWFIFEEVEIPVSEWDGAEPTVEVADETTVKVTFTDAHSVEASNFGVLAAIYDEQGDVYGIVFNDLFEDGVEFGTDYATLHFKKISDINAELAASAKGIAAKVTAAAGGVDVKGKVVICGKSFKIDGDALYTKVIVKDFDFNAGGITTGINGIATDADTKVFDLQGRRVVVPAKGLFIREGRKVVK